MTDLEKSINTEIYRSPYDPQWTEQVYSEGKTRDDLGIETLSEAILSDLIPGINNQTRRARYYSFWAWALHQFIQDPDVNPHTQNKFWEWLRNREAVLILGYLAHGCGGGLAGTEIGVTKWENGSQAVYDITWQSLKSVEGGSYELYYRGALQEMNIIVRSADSPHDDLSREIGIGLAGAYGVSVSKTQFVQHYLHATQLARDNFIDFAQKGCICQLPQSETERQLLINAFFRFDTPDLFAVKRLASLCYFLDVIQQSQGQPLRETNFRTAMFFWSYGGNHSYKPEGNLIEPAKRWRIFQLRQIFVFALEALWSSFLYKIQSNSMAADEYLYWLLGELDLQKLATHWGLGFPEYDPYILTLKEFFTSVKTSLTNDYWSDGTNALLQTLNEQALLNAIRSDRSHINVQTSTGAALLIFALIYWRCQDWQNTSGWYYVSNRFAAGRMPLDKYLHQIEHAFEAEWTVSAWVSWLHQNHLWLQHRKVALEKLLSRKKEVYKFEMVVPESENPWEVAKPRFHGLGVDSPKMNTPRFPSALNILKDLLLIESEQDGFQLTLEGVELLEKFRVYEIPPWKEVEDDQTLELTEETTG